MSFMIFNIKAGMGYVSHVNSDVVYDIAVYGINDILNDFGIDTHVPVRKLSADDVCNFWFESRSCVNKLVNLLGHEDGQYIIDYFYDLDNGVRHFNRFDVYRVSAPFEKFRDTLCDEEFPTVVTDMDEGWSDIVVTINGARETLGSILAAGDPISGEVYIDGDRYYVIGRLPGQFIDEIHITPLTGEVKVDFRVDSIYMSHR